MVDWTGQVLARVAAAGQALPGVRGRRYGHGGSSRAPERDSHLAMAATSSTSSARWSDGRPTCRATPRAACWPSPSPSRSLTWFVVWCGRTRPCLSSMPPRFPTTAGYDLARSAHALLASGFDHADALARLTVPTVLLHADWQLDPRDGTFSARWTTRTRPAPARPAEGPTSATQRSGATHGRIDPWSTSSHCNPGGRA